MRTLAYTLACCAGLVFVRPVSAFHDVNSSNSTSRADLARLAEGTHLFRIILHRAGVQPLEKVDDLRQEPERKLLIILGDLSVTFELVRTNTLKRFIEAGGAILLASNRPGYVPVDVFTQFIAGGVIRAREPQSAYHERLDCPFVVGTDADQSLFCDRKGKLDHVVTFQPAMWMSRRMTRPLTILGAFPTDCYCEPGNASVQFMPFAIGGPYGKGRLLVLSDHHVFMNAVLWQPDTDNVFFARNCVNWLTEGKRDQALFLENGQAQTRFDVPVKILPPPPLPPLETVVQAVDEGLVGLEEEDRFNGLLRSALASVPEDSLLRTIVFFVTLGLALFALSRLSHARQRFEPGTRPLSSLTRLLPSLSVVEQRQHAQLQEGNFWETAHALARQVFEPVHGTGEAASSWASVSLAGSWWQRRRLYSQVQRLWQLANRDEPTRVSARQLARLQRMADAVRAALADGRLGLGP